jgi:hypothetical protein
MLVLAGRVALLAIGHEQKYFDLEYLLQGDFRLLTAQYKSPA